MGRGSRQAGAGSYEALFGRGRRTVPCERDWKAATLNERIDELAQRHGLDPSELRQAWSSWETAEILLLDVADQLPAFADQLEIASVSENNDPEFTNFVITVPGRSWVLAVRNCGPLDLRTSSVDDGLILARRRGSWDEIVEQILDDLRALAAERPSYPQAPAPPARAQAASPQKQTASDEEQAQVPLRARA